MTAGFFLWCAALVGVALFAYWQRRHRIALEREHHIRAYVFPATVLREVTKTYPQLELKDVQLAARALREFFLIHARARQYLITMPSKVVDALWHAFILDTRAYESFCKQAFGAYFHHIPEGLMATAVQDRYATWRTWRLACLEENINPAKATRLPLLFALDAKLGIPGAQHYDPASFKKPLPEPGSSSSGCSGAGSSCGGSDLSDGCGGGGDSSGCGGGCGGGGD